MNNPLISDYRETIKTAEKIFGQFNYHLPMMDEDGMPVMLGDNFTVVFKMKDEQTGKLNAVKRLLWLL